MREVGWGRIPLLFIPMLRRDLCSDVGFEKRYSDLNNKQVQSSSMHLLKSYNHVQIFYVIFIIF